MAAHHHRDVLGNQIREHVAQVIVHDDAPLARHLRAVGTTMLVNVFENRKAERENLFGSAARTAPTVNRAQHFVNAALEEIVLVAEMRVEGRPSDIGAIENLFHRDRVVRLFAREADPGCGVGTGSLALAAKRHVRATGEVFGAALRIAHPSSATLKA